MKKLIKTLKPELDFNELSLPLLNGIRDLCILHSN